MQKQLVLLISALSTSGAFAQFKQAANPGAIVKPRQDLKTGDEVTAVAFSPDGQLVATTADKSFFIWRTATGARVFRFAFNSATNPNFHTQPLTAVTFSPDGKRVATAAKDLEVKLWDSQTGKFLASTSKLDATPKSLSFSPDGTTLAVGVGQALKLLDPASLRQKAELTVANESFRVVAYSGDGKTIAVGDSGHGNVRLYDATSGKQKRVFKVDGGIGFMAYSLDGHLVATASTVGQNPKRVEIRDASSGKVKATVSVDDDVWGLAFSPNAQMLAIASLDKTAKLVDAATGRVRVTFEGHENGLISIAFSADGKTLATGAHSNAFLWDVPSP